MSDYPQPITQINHVEPVARRIRGVLAGETIFDTLRALYVWERPQYPHYYVPRADVQMQGLTPTGEMRSTPQGDVRSFRLHTGGIERQATAQLIESSPIAGLNDTLRFDWKALDQWFEEDEEVFVHPRSPYTRVDALRSTRAIRVERDGVVLAKCSSPIMVFETGLPTRYYLDALTVAFDHLVPSQTRTECPYKGRVTRYWSAQISGKKYADIAWMYSFPTRQLLPIAGLIAFLNENVDIVIDGVVQARPLMHGDGIRTE